MRSVEVLLSSYNGSEYIEEQIQSILMQQDIQVHITIRDDGSKDDTLEILKELTLKHKDSLTVISGSNEGYRKSFLHLLSMAKEADYYCFSDQDDLWLPNKVIVAIKEIEALNSVSPILYASSVTITDSNLKPIGKNDISNMPNSIESYFTRGRLPGCTYVFNRSLMNIVKKFSDLDLPDLEMPDHDVVVGSCAFACGRVILDKNSYILHRRHTNSVTNGGTGLKKRIKSEWNIVFVRKNVRYSLVKRMLQIIPEDEFGQKQYEFLKMIVDYRDSIRNNWKLLTNKKMTTNILVCDIENKIKILLRNY